MKEQVDDAYQKLGKRGGPPAVAVPSSITRKQQLEMQDRAKRRTQLRIDDRERLRKSIQAERCIQHVWEVTEVLRTDKGLTSNRIQALKASMVGKMGLLSKVLPDLKSVEASKSPDSDNPRSMSTADLMALVEGLVERPVIEAVEAEYVEIPTPKMSTSEPGW